tara:strand:+ start:98 stop:295 length:198 start_codon:yes stop_codon:yes gene_type:complete
MEYVSIIRFYSNESKFDVRVHGTVQYTVEYISGYLQGLQDKNKNKFNFEVLSSEPILVMRKPRLD